MKLIKAVKEKRLILKGVAGVTPQIKAGTLSRAFAVPTRSNRGRLARATATANGKEHGAFLSRDYCAMYR